MLSAEVKELLQQLLVVDPENRLGYGSEDAESIKK
jgi:hypothetical protein